MPRFDKTGPNGEGPMTGRKLGNCNTEEKNMNGIGMKWRRCMKYRCRNFRNNERF